MLHYAFFEAAIVATYFKKITLKIQYVKYEWKKLTTMGGGTTTGGSWFQWGRRQL